LLKYLEEGEIDRNELLVAHNGRDPALKLMRDGVECKLKDWADDLLKGMQSVAELLDQHKEKTPYQDALQLQRNKVLDPDLTPSARMINEMRETKETFYDFAERMSQKHNQYFTNLNLSAERNQFFDKAVVESIKKQQQIEALDDMSFDDYLQAYFEQ